MCRLRGSVLAFTLLSAHTLVGEDPPAVLLPAGPIHAGPIQQKATDACTSCHEARIIVQQRLSQAAWTREMDKMIKWGAEVDPKDRDALIDYFSVNFGPDQAAYEASRTAAKAVARPRPTAKH
jgi:hypothetical protein